MQRTKSFLGYAWAALALPIVLGTFLGMPHWAKLLATSTGIKVSPRFSGGEIVHTNLHEVYETRIHRPVFDGLISERPQGFVQVDWMQRNPQVSLPSQIEETIDYDANGIADFRAHIDMSRAVITIKPMAENVLGVGQTYFFEKGAVVRVQLRK